MSARQSQKATAIVWDAYEINRDITADTFDEFRSALIVAYEHALEQGISPRAALAAILDMAASEMQRI
jgi:hypothetical protein